MAAFSATYAHTVHEAEIKNKYGLHAAIIKKGLFLCSRHDDQVLQRRNVFGVWKTLKDSCPNCDRERMNTQGTPATTTQMPQPPPLPVTQSQASNQIPTTSNSPPIENTFAILDMNDSSNVTNTEAEVSTATTVLSTIADILSEMKEYLNASKSQKKQLDYLLQH